MDGDTFVTLVREAELTLYRVSKAILVNESDCADAVQEGILKAYANLHTLRDERYFKTWLVRILIRECYKIRKSGKRFTSYEEYAAKESSGEVQDYSELYTAIMELKEDLRIVVVLYYISGFSSMEIARILKIPKGTVNSRMARARAELKKRMEDEERMSAVWIG